MARKKRGARALGPYEHGRQWRVIVVDPGGKRTSRFYGTRRQAAQVVSSLNRELGVQGSPTVDEALEAYEKHLKEKGNKPGSIKTTMSRLRSLFVDGDEFVSAIDRVRGEKLYAELRGRKPSKAKDAQRKTAVDTHRNTLAEAKTFLNWCIEHYPLHVRDNPLAGIKGAGKRKKGKPQLRVDEARRWAAKAHELADAGELGAVGALMALYLGLRAGEITNLVVRDIDDGGRLVWITESKTAAGRRQVQVPEPLVPYLRQLSQGRPATKKVFGQHWRDWVRKWVGRICHEADVPRVSAHGMRGLHATLATLEGMSGSAVARALGHESPRTTKEHYTDAAAEEAARHATVLRVLQGGR